MGKLLFDTYPLIVDPNLAAITGLNEAIILQQLHYWLEINSRDKRNCRDGFYWTYNTYEKWQKQFPFWSVRTIRRIISNLEKQGLVVAGNYNRLKIDRTKWYRLNYEKLESLSNSPLGQNGHMEQANLTRPLPETIFAETKKDYIGNFPKENPTLSFLQHKNQNHVDSEKDYAINYFIKRLKDVADITQRNLKDETWREVIDTLFIMYDASIGRQGKYFDLDVDSIVSMTDHYCDNVVAGKYKAAIPCISHFNSEGIKKVSFYSSAYYE